MEELGFSSDCLELVVLEGVATCFFLACGLDLGGSGCLAGWELGWAGSITKFPREPRSGNWWPIGGGVATGTGFFPISWRVEGFVLRCVERGAFFFGLAGFCLGDCMITSLFGEGVVDVRSMASRFGAKS